MSQENPGSVGDSVEEGVGQAVSGSGFSAWDFAVHLWAYVRTTIC